MKLTHKSRIAQAMLAISLVAAATAGCSQNQASTPVALGPTSGIGTLHARGSVNGIQGIPPGYPGGPPAGAGAGGVAGAAGASHAPVNIYR